MENNEENLENIRTYEQIIFDYLNFIAKATNNEEFLPENYLNVPNEEIIVKKARAFKSLIDKCYDPVNGDFYFIKFVLGDLMYAGYPNTYRVNKLIKKWGKLLRTKKLLCIMCSRGFGKTLRISIIESIKRCYLFANYRVLIDAASADQVEDEIIGPIKRIINSNEVLKAKLSNFGKSTRDTISYNGGKIEGKGVGSEARGKHVNLILMDDILRSDNRLNKKQIEAEVFEVLMPMIRARKGQMVLVGTPQNEQDIFNHIKELSEHSESSWYFEAFPAIISYEKKIVQCPDRFTFEELLQMRRDMGLLKFDKEYQVCFRSDASSIFPTQIVDVCKSKEDIIEYKPDLNAVYVMGVDLARSGSASADYSVYTVLKIQDDGKVKIAYVERLKGVKIQIQVEKIDKLSKRFNDCFVLVEKNNMGQDFIDLLIDDYGTYVKAITTGGKGSKKEDLIRMLVNKFEHENIIIPWGDEESREIMREVIHELNSFSSVITPAGNERMEGVGAKDDCVLSLAIAVRATQYESPIGAVGLEPPNSNKPLIDKHESDLVNKIRLGIIK